MINVMTFDLEEWYHSNLPSVNGRFKREAFHSRLEAPTYRLLEILEDTGNTATFFVLGSVAEEHKQLLRDIHAAGHEIGSHGFAHDLIYELGPEGFRKDVERGVGVLEDIVGEKVIGFRAPSWSVPDAEWFWETLAENGIVYDSSHYPFRTYLYGSNQYLRHRHWVDRAGKRFLEWPPSVGELLGRRVPFAGGFFFRVLPEVVIKGMIVKFVKELQEPVVLYLHPWEIDRGIPRLSIPLKDKIVLYANIDSCESKLIHILRTFKFSSFRERIRSIDSAQAGEASEG